MAISFTKDPEEVLDYLLDWSARLPEGDTIATSTWIMPDPINGDVVKDSDDNTDTTTSIWLSAGTLGGKYTLINRVVTSGGRTMDQTCVVKIKAR